MRARYWPMFLLTAFCGATVASLSNADSPADPTRAVAVAYADLDLSKDAGAQALYRRIRAAARAVCRAADRDFDLEARRSQRACVREAVDDAVTRIGNASLTSLHSSESAQANTLW